jgi:hypothetical protein
MRNAQVTKWLFLALGIEVAIALICLLATGAWVSLVIMVMIYGLLVGGIYVMNQFGLWNGNSSWWDANKMSTAQPTGFSGSSPNMGIGINLGTGPERAETINLNIPLDDTITALQVDLSHGNLRVVGQEGAKEIKITAVKRVFVRDEYIARNELDRLQVRQRREGNLIKIEAGPADQAGQPTNVTIGRASRIDLEMTAPPALAATLGNSFGDLIVKDYQGELSARTGAGSLIVENYNSGRTLRLSSNAGRIAAQQVAAGTVYVRTGAGAIELTGVGAENFDLESAAGMIRARGVNCARYIARAQMGSVDLYDARIERELIMTATAGRVQAENITSNGFQLETTTGTVFYRGTPPLYNSFVKSALGTVEMLLLAGGSFNLDARSNLGNVTVGLPLSSTYASSRNAFSGVVGAGGPQLQLQTQVGNIRVAQV